MITSEIIRMEKEVESMERELLRRDREFEKLSKMASHEPFKSDDRLNALLELDRLLSEMLIAKGKAMIARAKSMTARDIRQIGQAHLARVKARYKINRQKVIT